MSGRNGIIDPRIDPKIREAMARLQEQQIQVDPFAVAIQYFGLSTPTAQAMGMRTEPCPCGKCAGVRVAFDNALHFIAGQGVGLIPRSTPAGPSVKPTNPKAGEMT